MFLPLSRSLKIFGFNRFVLRDELVPEDPDDGPAKVLLERIQDMRKLV